MELHGNKKLSKNKYSKNLDKMEKWIFFVKWTHPIRHTSARFSPKKKLYFLKKG